MKNQQELIQDAKLTYLAFAAGDETIAKLLDQLEPLGMTVFEMACLVCDDNSCLPPMQGGGLDWESIKASARSKV